MTDEPDPRVKARSEAWGEWYAERPVSAKPSVDRSAPRGLPWLWNALLDAHERDYLARMGIAVEPEADTPLVVEAKP